MSANKGIAPLGSADAAFQRLLPLIGTLYYNNKLATTTNYISSQITSTLGGAVTAFAVNLFRASPLIITRKTTFDQITFRVATGGSTGSVARAGIYADNGASYPGALLVDGGENDTTGTGLMTKTISVTLNPGLYWLVYLCGVAQCTPQLLGQASIPSILGSDGTNNIIGWSVSQTYGALPANYPAGGTPMNTTNNLVWVGLRIASVD